MVNIPIIDVEATSKKLKAIRVQHNLSVAQLQEEFAMENPQSIYNWENPDNKTLPCIDNLVILAKLYKIRIDDLLVIQEEISSIDSVKELAEPFNISIETIEFIKRYSSKPVLNALENYYEIKLL
ncbi:MAG: helix-turn-helix transcriptional regulator [Spirochaetia bacterium]|nr:helix-turn-helix transcriptional regulator [Spirochaetia bacterium]